MIRKSHAGLALHLRLRPSIKSRSLSRHLQAGFRPSSTLKPNYITPLKSYDRGLAQLPWTLNAPAGTAMGNARF